MRSQGAAFAFDGIPARETSREFLERALNRRSSEARGEHSLGSAKQRCLLGSWRRSHVGAQGIVHG
jgi:hypothetical protein